MTDSIGLLHLSKKLSKKQGVATLKNPETGILKQDLEAQLCEAQAQGHALLFETCLRKIWIIRKELWNELAPQQDLMESFAGSEAYQFLLEVICGLCSPVVGETEVFGQFKEQIAKPLKPQSLFFKWVGKLLTDAKEIRRDHLTHLGSQSYGSFCRRQLVDFAHIDIIGLGQFTQSLLPWIEKAHVQGRIYTRDVNKYENQVSTEFNLFPWTQFGDSSKPTSPSALLICAPIAADEISKKVQSYDLIIDLRETSETDSISHAHGLNLDSVFSEIRKGSKNAHKQKEQALVEVKKRAQKINNSMTLRPFGWDDICA